MDNAQRATRFASILDTIATTDSADLQESMFIDLLADAMHWCDANGEDFHIALAQACRHYIHELNDQQEDERRL
jgi:hypothetical protein